MTSDPQSTAARYRQPASRLRSWRLLAGLLTACGPLAAQSAAGNRTIVAETDFAKEAAGTTVLARLAKGAPVHATAIRGARAEVTLEGWIAANALRDEKRDGFDVAVSLVAGTPVRAGAGTGATIATAKGGALFQRIATHDGWVQVRRSGWVASDQLASVGSALAKPAAATGARPDTTPAPVTPAPATPRTAPPTGTSTLMGGSTFATSAGGGVAGVVEAPIGARLLDRKDGWSRVQLEVWVRDDAIGTPVGSGLTAADLRADPEKYIGQQVEWTLQVLAVQRADELRPELPLKQPYVLARGPLPESGFVYLVIPEAEIDRFKALEPLARIKVLATVRVGRSRHLPTPVIDFVRRIN